MISKKQSKTVIGLTMGDPAGVGPELVVRALANPELQSLCNLVAFADFGILQRQASQLDLSIPALQVLSPAAFLSQPPDQDAWPCVVDIQAIDPKTFQPGEASPQGGQVAFDLVQRAIDAAQHQRIDAITTCPLNKKALNLAGIQFPGHTEMFAERGRASRPGRWCMMQYSDIITCTFATVHIGYLDVVKHLSVERVFDTIDLTDQALSRIRQRPPHIVVCGLNPHAGEGGLFGDREEETFILPAIEKARSQGIDVEGPLPPDTAFLPWKRDITDAYVCMYHDQGHIPVKALAFDQAVNTTIGLDLIRTSVDHGTAYDIAWGAGGSRKVDDSSLCSAIRLATRLASKS